MARQSIVDFYLDAKRAVPDDHHAMKADVELAYAQLVGPVREVLGREGPLAEGMLFKKIDATTDFSQFRTALGAMETRGLVRAERSAAGDPVFSLARPDGAT
jgi:hypothetical protein